MPSTAAPAAPAAPSVLASPASPPLSKAIDPTFALLVAPASTIISVLYPSQDPAGQDSKHSSSPAAAIRSELLTCLLQDLSALLKSPSSIFWTAILWPPEPASSWLTFFDVYLATQVDRNSFSKPIFRDHGVGAEEFERSAKVGVVDASGDLDTHLSRKVFQFARRLVFQLDALVVENTGSATKPSWKVRLGPSESGVRSDRSAADVPLPIPRLTDILRVYFMSNRASLSELFSIACVRCPWLPLEISDAVDFVAQMVRSTLRRLAKTGGGPTSSGGKGKGKGKGDDANKGKGAAGSSASAAASPTTQSPPDETLKEVFALTDALLSFEALVLADVGSSRSTTSVLASSTFFTTLIGCYEIANALTAGSSAFRSGSEMPLPLQSSMDTIHDMDLDSHSETGGPMKPAAMAFRRMKLACISLADSILNVHLLESFISSDDTVLTPPATSETVDQLCDLIIQCLEAAPFDGPVSFLLNAPLLVDLDVECGLYERLRRVREIVVQKNADGSDDAEGHPRLDFLLASLEQMVTFSGNMEARRIRANQKDAMRAARERRGQIKHRQDREFNSDVMLSSSAAPPVEDEEYVKRTILISQVQDLFPELGEGFIEACLVAFNDDPELVIMKVLEDDLPDVVKRLDKSMARTAPISTRSPPSLPPSNEMALVKVEKPSKPDILSSRKNIFDNDDFDVFSGKKRDMSKVVFGKKDKVRGQDTLAADEKELVLASAERVLAEELETSDSPRPRADVGTPKVDKLGNYDNGNNDFSFYAAEYDDEYDDSYDSADVKLAGTVELRMIDEEESTVDRSRFAAPEEGGAGEDEATAGEAAFEREMVAIVMAGNSKLLERESRKTVARQRLRLKTGRSDEQIEGWYKMYLRDPRKQKKLQEENEWRGEQNAIQTPAWRPKRDDGNLSLARGQRNESTSGGGGRGGQQNAAPRANTDSQDASEDDSQDDDEKEAGGADGGENRSGSGRGRGAVPGGAWRGGGGRGTSKGGRGGGGNRSKANHGRREGHARKLAKGMGGPVL